MVARSGCPASRTRSQTALDRVAAAGPSAPASQPAARRTPPRRTAPKQHAPVSVCRKRATPRNRARSPRCRSRSTGGRIAAFKLCRAAVQLEHPDDRHDFTVTVKSIPGGGYNWSYDTPPTARTGAGPPAGARSTGSCSDDSSAGPPGAGGSGGGDGGSGGDDGGGGGGGPPPRPPDAHSHEVLCPEQRTGLLRAVGLGDQVSPDATVLLVEADELDRRAVETARTGTCQPAEVDLTGRDFVLLAVLPPLRGEAGGWRRVVPLAVSRQLTSQQQQPGGAAAEVVGLFEAADAGGVFKGQRRSRNKVAAGAVALKTSGMTWAACTPTSAPGLYAHLLDHARGPSRRAHLVRLLRKLTAVLRRQHPRHMDLLAAHCRGREHHGAGTGPFCTLSFAYNYHNRIHVDQDDPPLSFITWWLTGTEGSLRGGAFRLANAGVRFTPLHGTTLLLNTRRLYHGTEACTTSSGGNLRRMGSALWVREAVVSAWRAWVSGAKQMLRKNRRRKAKSCAEATEYVRLRLLAAWGKTQRRSLRARVLRMGRPAAEGCFAQAAVREADGCWDAVAVPAALVVQRA